MTVPYDRWMDCSEWFHWLARLFVILGALIGGVGASRTVRRWVETAPERFVDKALALGRALVLWLRRRWAATKEWYRRQKRTLLNWLDQAKQRLGLTNDRSVRITAVSTVAVTDAATATVTESLGRRVANLEAWRTEENQDRRIGAWFLVVGFLLIFVGELLDVLFC